ncbi:Uncharacterised protein [Mycobacteroides abscessus]|nr:Uncharacterised protein [Mycobacteroides abscessus]
MVGSPTASGPSSTYAASLIVPSCTLSSPDLRTPARGRLSAYARTTPVSFVLAARCGRAEDAG